MIYKRVIFQIFLPIALLSTVSGQILTGPCRSDSCLNGASCQPRAHNNHACKCQFGFTGASCELKRPYCIGRSCKCHLDFCANGGECYLADIGRPQCRCPEGFYGLYCDIDELHIDLTDDEYEDYEEADEEPVDFCEGSPCENDGHCVNRNDGYLCQCEDPFFGSECQFKRDPCETQICENKARCVPIEDTYTCDCPRGYEGKFCEKTMDMCRPSPCQNGGYCENHRPGFYNCTCPEGFVGRDCEERIDYCANAPCLNNGNCVNLVADFKCDCPLEYTGMICERLTIPEITIIEASTSTTETTALIVPEYTTNTFDDPYVNCPNSNYCREVLRDGKCDEICNNEECVFDGNDCKNDTIEVCPQLCRDRSGDGDCDLECNLFACKWDGGDCEIKTTVLTEELGLVLETNSSDFIKFHDGFTTEMDAVLGVNLRLKTDENGPLMENRPDGLLVRFDVEILNANDYTFKETASVARFIEALKEKGELPNIGMPIHSAVTLSREETESVGKKFVQYACGLLFLLFVLGTVLAPRMRRKRKLFETQLEELPLENEVKRPYHDQHAVYGFDGAAAPFDRLPAQQRQLSSLPPRRTRVSKTSLEPTQLHIQAGGEHPIPLPIDDTAVNALGPHGRTPLICVVGNEYGKSLDDLQRDARLLIENGADLNARDDDDQTAIMVAVQAVRYDLVKTLLDSGADPTIPNKFGNMCLHYAASECNALMVELLLTDSRVKENIDYYNNENLTPLIRNALEDSEDTTVVELLLENGASINYAGESGSGTYTGKTALHHAAHGGHVKTVEYLCDKGANVNAADTDGQTPLHLAADGGHLEVVEVLAKAGADLAHADKDQVTPKDIAIKKERTAIVKFLETQIDQKPLPLKPSKATKRKPLYTKQGTGKRGRSHATSTSVATISQQPVTVSQPGYVTTPHHSVNGNFSSVFYTPQSLNRVPQFPTMMTPNYLHTPATTLPEEPIYHHYHSPLDDLLIHQFSPDQFQNFQMSDQTYV